MTKVTVITAECGEAQLADNLNSVQQQVGIDVEHIVISGCQSALEAETQIHKSAVKVSATSDWILRLDADMVLTAGDTIERMVVAARSMEHAKHRLSLPVLDFFTQRDIDGVHLLRSTAVPKAAQIGPYNPELWIRTIPGRVAHRDTTPRILHGWNPDVAQSLRFGLHRGLKAVERGPRTSQWSTIAWLWRHCRMTDDPVVDAALLGVLVGLGELQGEVDWSIVDVGGPGFIKLCQSVEAKPPAKGRLLSKTPAQLHFSVFGSHYESARAVLAHVLRARNS